MPLGLFGSATKLQQLDSRAASSGHCSTELRDSKGTIVKLPKHTVTIEKKLAEGGFAIVFLATDKHNRHYALKRQFINDDPRQLEACQRECRIVSCLSGHKNIVAYADHLLTKNSSGVYEYSLLTAYYKNSVLQLMNERLSSGRCLSSKEILSIFCDICEAVARLHHSQTPVIHRDLKVENVLIDDRRRGVQPFYVLCDFGSATTKVLSAETHSLQYIEEDINRYTTISYRAPEMIDLCSCQPIGTKSDIWALGVMLYKLCYFILPFGENSLAIQNCSYNFPSQPVYSDELQAIIKCLLDVNIDHRPDIFQTASLAFEADGRISPIGNLNKVRRISLSEIVAIFRGQASKTSDDFIQVTENPNKAYRNQDLKSSRSSSSKAEQVSLKNDGTTSVNPRLRPKPLSSLNRLGLAISGTNQVSPQNRGKEKSVLTADASCLQSFRQQSSLSNPDIGPVTQQSPDSMSKSELFQATFSRDYEVNIDSEHIQNVRPTEQLEKNRVKFPYESSSSVSTGHDSSFFHASAPQLSSCNREWGHGDKLGMSSLKGLNKWSVNSDRLKSSAFKPYSAERDNDLTKKSSAIDSKNISSLSFERMDENDSSWNPFLDAPFEIISNNANSIMDDRSFGVCFDGLPRAGAGAHESPELDLSDPFGAAPFDFNILQHLKSSKKESNEFVPIAEGKHAFQNEELRACKNGEKTIGHGIKHGYFDKEISAGSSESHPNLGISEEDKTIEPPSTLMNVGNSKISDVTPYLSCDILKPANSTFSKETVPPLSHLHSISNPFSNQSFSSEDSNLRCNGSQCIEQKRPPQSAPPHYEDTKMRLPEEAINIINTYNPFKDKNSPDEANKRILSVSSSSSGDFAHTDDSGTEIFTSENARRFTFSPRLNAYKKFVQLESNEYHINASFSDGDSKHGDSVIRTGTLGRSSFVNNSYQAEDWENPLRSARKNF